MEEAKIQLSNKTIVSLSGNGQDIVEIDVDKVLAYELLLSKIQETLPKLAIKNLDLWSKITQKTASRSEIICEKVGDISSLSVDLDKYVSEAMSIYPRNFKLLEQVKRYEKYVCGREFELSESVNNKSVFDFIFPNEGESAFIVSSLKPCVKDCSIQRIYGNLSSVLSMKLNVDIGTSVMEVLPAEVKEKIQTSPIFTSNGKEYKIHKVVINGSEIDILSLPFTDSNSNEKLLTVLVRQLGLKKANIEINQNETKSVAPKEYENTEKFNKIFKKLKDGQSQYPSSNAQFTLSVVKITLLVALLVLVGATFYFQSRTVGTLKSSLENNSDNLYKNLNCLQVNLNAILFAKAMGSLDMNDQASNFQMISQCSADLQIQLQRISEPRVLSEVNSLLEKLARINQPEKVKEIEESNQVLYELSESLNRRSQLNQVIGIDDAKSRRYSEKYAPVILFVVAAFLVCFVTILAKKFLKKHSLLSLDKWFSKKEKEFLARKYLQPLKDYICSILSNRNQITPPKETKTNNDSLSSEDTQDSSKIDSTIIKESFKLSSVDTDDSISVHDTTINSVADEVDTSIKTKTHSLKRIPVLSFSLLFLSLLAPFGLYFFSENVYSESVEALSLRQISREYNYKIFDLYNQIQIFYERILTGKSYTLADIKLVRSKHETFNDFSQRNFQHIIQFANKETNRINYDNFCDLIASTSNVKCVPSLINVEENKGLSYILTLTEQSLNENFNYALNPKIVSNTQYFKEISKQSNFRFIEENNKLIMEAFNAFDTLVSNKAYDTLSRNGIIESVCFLLSIGSLIIMYVMIWPRIEGAFQSFFNKIETEVRILPTIVVKSLPFNKHFTNCFNLLESQ